MDAGNEAMLASYRPLVDFLTSVYGQQNDIVLYRVDPDTVSGQVLYASSGRYQPGDSLGAIGRRVLAESHKGYHYLINLSQQDGEEGDPRKISYYLIRNAGGEIAGMLLIAFEVDYLLKAKKVLDQILGFAAIKDRPLGYNDFYQELETEEFSISRYAQHLIAGVLDEYKVPPERLTMEEKAEIVAKLEKLELFHIRGSVKLAAGQLHISVPTLYRLLKRDS